MLFFSRLNISALEGTPGRTPASEGFARKRKRVAEPESSFSSFTSITGTGRGLVKESAASSDFVSTSSAKDVVEVFELDPEGKFVKLFNSAEKVKGSSDLTK